MFDIIFKLFFRIIPANYLSMLFGKLAATSISKHFIALYIKYFNVDVSLMTKPPEQFKTLGEFFTREIKLSERPIDNDPSHLISPVDGIVSAIGDIRSNTLMQAKGISYSLGALLAYKGEYISRLSKGRFITIYLSPKDYHRIHVPLDGQVVASTYMPGKLYPVNSRSARLFPNLFTTNERLITYLETEHGCLALVKVGAMNVGSIKVSYDPRLKSNQLYPRRKMYSIYEQPIEVKKGEELGLFELGSTVILLFEADKFDWIIPDIIGSNLKMGSAIASKPAAKQ